MASQAINNAGSVGTPTQVVVGLFKHAYEAHEALSQLRASGFTAEQIGAAFSTRNIGKSDTARLAGSAGYGHENWWEKVKDAFRTDDTVERRGENESLAEDRRPYDTDSPASDYEYELGSNDFEQSLAGTGISQKRASYLTRNLEPGGAIVTVNDSNRALDAEEILAANNARVRYEDVEGAIAGAAYTGSNTDTVEATNTTAPYIRGTEPAVDPETVNADLEDVDFDNTDRSLAGGASAGVPPEPLTGRSNGERVQLFGEVLRAHKDRVSRGEVRIHKDVVTENQTIEVPVTREELVLERVPVSGNTVAAGNIGQEREIRVPLSEEIVRLEKQETVREELLIGKRDVSHVASVSDAVRHEELRVDSENPDLKRGVTGEEGPEDLRRQG